MSEQHTKEPWMLSERPNGPFIGIYSEYSVNGEHSKNGRQAIAAVHYESKKGAIEYHKMFLANARRIVACVNACAGVPTELLEECPAPFSALRSERDELLVALETLARSLPQIGCERAQMMDYANAAIAKAKESAI